MHDKDLRDKTLLDLPEVKSSIGQSMYKYAGAKDWNSLPSKCREITSIYPLVLNVLFICILELDNNSHICIVYKFSYLYSLFRLFSLIYVYYCINSLVIISN